MKYYEVEKTDWQKIFWLFICFIIPFIGSFILIETIKNFREEQTGRPYFKKIVRYEIKED